MILKINAIKFNKIRYKRTISKKLKWVKIIAPSSFLFL